MLVGGQQAVSNVQVVGDSQITCRTPIEFVLRNGARGGANDKRQRNRFNRVCVRPPARQRDVTVAGSIGGYIEAMAAQGNYGYAGEVKHFSPCLMSQNPSAPTPVARLAMPGFVQDIVLFFSIRAGNTLASGRQ